MAVYCYWLCFCRRRCLNTVVRSPLLLAKWLAVWLLLAPLLLLVIQFSIAVRGLANSRGFLAQALADAVAALELAAVRFFHWAAAAAAAAVSAVACVPTSFGLSVAASAATLFEQQRLACECENAKFQVWLRPAKAKRGWLAGCVCAETDRPTDRLNGWNGTGNGIEWRRLANTLTD